MIQIVKVSFNHHNIAANEIILEHCKLEEWMADDSEEEKKRVQFYRSQLSFRKDQECPVEYIFGYQRLRGHDFYKIKWAGWPEQAWTWGHTKDIEAGDTLGSFRQKLLSVIPPHLWPKRKQLNYKVPEEYQNQMLPDYAIKKKELRLIIIVYYVIITECDRLYTVLIRNFRHKLDTRQAQLRELDPTVLIENEEDLVDFPSPSTYTFTKDPIYKAYQPSRNGDVLACPEGGKCGDCSTSFHYAWELQWSRAKKVDHDRAMHYHQTEASKKSEPYWKVAHTKTHIIIECTSSCACVKNGTCTNNLVQKRRENPLPFGELPFSSPDPDQVEQFQLFPPIEPKN